VTPPAVAPAARFLAPLALLPEGFARDVRLDVDARGRLVAVEPGAAAGPGVTPLAGPVLPGVPDLHCHAFQRAMAGLAERAGPSPDTFWTWRETMYALVARLAPHHLRAVAAQCYVELLAGGYTSVCEFHYVHRDPGGHAYAAPEEMALQLVEAARCAGIGLTLLPVLYQAGAFGGGALHPAQRRFAGTPDEILRIADRLRATHAGDDLRVGVAPHSLRAVPPEALRALVAGIDALDPGAPVHIHVAEQVREVEECLAWSGRRPVAWLLEHAALSPRWCLVHATHVTPEETAGLARSGAVAGLCPTTEANLGDGLFPLADHLAAGGRLGIGSDSNVSTSVVEELRWLEYGQRLLHRRRNVAAAGPGASVGLTLYGAAVAGGAQAAGRPVGGLRPGQRADFVVLDAEAPALLGRPPERLLDALVFAGGQGAVRDVMVGGRRVVESGRHVRAAEILAGYRQAIAELGEGA
jgi:formimidoylglutamate deiminase